MEEKSMKMCRMSSLSEEEIFQKYEKTPTAPIIEGNENHIKNGPTSQNNCNERARMMEQTKRLLEFSDPHRDGVKLRKSQDVGKIEPNNSDSDDSDDDDTDKTICEKIDDDYQRPAKLDLIVGFLRFFNFISCCTSVFAVTLSLLFSISEPSKDLRSSVNMTTLYYIWSPIHDSHGMDSDKTLYYREDDPLLFYLKVIASFVILVYLVITAVFVIIDSVATVTFRWKEYGELSFRHTDATSVLFLLSKSRWKLRLLTCLTIASAASLQTTQIILDYYGRSLEVKRSEVTGQLLPSQVPPHALHAVIWYIGLMVLGVVSFLIGIMLQFIPPSIRSVPWLDNNMTDVHVDDKGDIWKSSEDIWCQILSAQDLVSQSSSTIKSVSVNKNIVRRKRYQQFTILGYVLECLKKLLYFLSYVIAIAMNLRAILLMELSATSFEFWTCVISTSCTSLISLYLVILICIQSFRLPPRQTPFLSKIYVPFTLSSGTELITGFFLITIN